MADATDSVYVAFELPSGKIISMVMKKKTSLKELHEVVESWLRVKTVVLLRGCTTLYREVPDFEDSIIGTIEYISTERGTLRLKVIVPYGNIFFETKVQGRYNYAYDREDAFRIFSLLFDDFDGTFRGTVEEKSGGKFKYVPPNKMRILPWIALTGETYYILAGKKQNLLDVLVPDDDCEIVGMTIIEKFPGSYVEEAPMLRRSSRVEKIFSLFERMQFTSVSPKEVSSNKPRGT